MHSIHYATLLQDYCHSFRPLVYLFTAHHESKECVQLLCSGVKWIANKYFNAAFSPAVGVIDRAQGLHAGLMAAFGKTSQEQVGEDEDYEFCTMQCWPHIASA